MDYLILTNVQSGGADIMHDKSIDFIFQAYRKNWMGINGVVGVGNGTCALRIFESISPV